MQKLTYIFLAIIGISIPFHANAEDAVVSEEPTLLSDQVDKPTSEEQATEPAEISAPPSLTPEQTEKARMDALKVLIKRKQYPQAYELASRLLAENEGLPNFDFLYGMAAVESGHYDDALFSFERLVLSFPNQPRYRLELARTHFYLKNLVRSEVEFNNVLKQNPPAPVKKNVELFLDRIAELKRSFESKFMFVVDIGGGYDSNINSATSEDFIPSEELNDSLTNLGDITITEDGRETGSVYWNALAHMLYVAPLTKTSALDGRVAVSTKSHAETPIYDLTTIIGELGYSIYTGPLKWRAAGRYQMVQVDGESFLTSPLFLGQANWILDEGANIGLGINYGNTLYENNSDGDLTQQQYNLFYASKPDENTWKLSLIFGSDTADESTNEHNGKSYQGFTYQSTTLTGQYSSRYWTLQVLSSEYDSINPFFSKLRKDQNATLAIGWRHQFTSNFSFRHDYSLSYNDSSLSTYTYKRAKAELGLSYRF